MDERGEQKRRNAPGAKPAAKPPAAKQPAAKPSAAKPPRARSAIPDKASIVATETFTSPKGRRYTILETNQIDPYDDPGNGRRKRRGS